MSSMFVIHFCQADEAIELGDCYSGGFLRNMLRVFLRNADKRFYSAAASSTTLRENELEKFRKLSNEWWDVTGPFKALHSLNKLRWVILYGIDWLLLLNLIFFIVHIEYIQGTFGEEWNENISDIIIVKKSSCHAISWLQNFGCGLWRRPAQREPCQARSQCYCDWSLWGKYNCCCSACWELWTGQHQLPSQHCRTTQSRWSPPCVWCSHCIRSLRTCGQSRIFYSDMQWPIEGFCYSNFMPIYLEYAKLTFYFYPQPGGSLFLTTINRTTVSLLFGIGAAEYLLNLVPKGTHDWNKFITPGEITTYLTNSNNISLPILKYISQFFQLLSVGDCQLRQLVGMKYNPLTNNWGWTSITSINYALHATKSARPTDSLSSTQVPPQSTTSQV